MNINSGLAIGFCIAFLACQPNGEKAEKLQTGKIEEKVEETVRQEKYIDLLNVDYVMGHFDPAIHPEMHKIDSKYADRAGLFMHKEAYHAFLEMNESAAKSGIKLIIRSAARNFSYQKSIWEAKWSGSRLLSGSINAEKAYPNEEKRATEIMKYSAMPGASRHHWGTEIDFNAFENSYFESGEGKRVFVWLEKNAPTFGFDRPYTANRPTGYEEEKWHWSYLPIAKELTNYVKENISDTDISGFSGASTSEELKVKENYILGIAKNCL